MHKLLVLVLALAALRVATATEADGPYVVRNAAGRLEAWSVVVTAEGARRRAAPVAVGDKLFVAAVGSLPAFAVQLRAPEPDAPDTVRGDARQPLFVVADTHGEFQILADMLMKHGIVDSALQWKFGRGRLVFLGDVFDRGAHQLEILWLIYGLEAQARNAGGAVYFVLGNHETMNLLYDLRYMNAKYRETEALLGHPYPELFDKRSVLGQWLRSKPAVLKLGSLLCVHGGISPALLTGNYALPEINQRVREVLNAGDKVPDADYKVQRSVFLFSTDGPLWYRGYFPAEASGALATAEDIDRIRTYFGVERILVGHTKVPTITPLYDGKVIAVQVYPGHDSFGNEIFEALLIRDGVLLRAHPDGRTERLLP